MKTVTLKLTDCTVGELKKALENIQDDTYINIGKGHKANNGKISKGKTKIKHTNKPSGKQIIPIVVIIYSNNSPTSPFDM